MSNQDLNKKLDQLETILLDLKKQVRDTQTNLQSDTSDTNKPGTDTTDHANTDHASNANVTTPQEKESKPMVQKDDKKGESIDEEDKGPPIGEVGTFQGEFVLMPNDKKYQVPPNYASKTQLVVGDKLKLISHGDQNEFKIEKQIERIELEGILTKKNFQWVAAVNECDFRLIPAAIKYYEGEIGDQVIIVVPSDFKTKGCDWAAVKKVIKVGRGEGGYAGSRTTAEIQKDKKMKHVVNKKGEKVIDKIRKERDETKEGKSKTAVKDTNKTPKAVTTKSKSKPEAPTTKPPTPAVTPAVVDTSTTIRASTTTSSKTSSMKGEIDISKASGEIELSDSKDTASASSDITLDEENLNDKNDFESEGVTPLR